MTAERDEHADRFLRDFARELGVDELTPEALATSLGFDELTPEKLDAWFRRDVLGMDGNRDGEPVARVVQVDRDEPRTPRPGLRALLPAVVSRAKRKRG